MRKVKAVVHRNTVTPSIALPKRQKKAPKTIRMAPHTNLFSAKKWAKELILKTGQPRTFSMVTTVVYPFIEK